MSNVKRCSRNTGGIWHTSIWNVFLYRDNVAFVVLVFCRKFVFKILIIYFYVNFGLINIKLSVYFAIFDIKIQVIITLNK